MKSYPVFEDLRFEDLAIFNKEFLDNPPSISEYTFTNLYAWREPYKLKACLLGRFIILRSEAGPQMRFFDPIGTGDKKSVMEEIFQKDNGIFVRLPEETIALFSNDPRFQVGLDRDNSDYLYKAEELITLQGAKYDGKRNRIKKFRSTCGYEYIPMTAMNAQECMAYEDQWCILKNCDGVEGLSHERQAIREMTKHFLDFELVGGAIKIEGMIRAVALAQRLNPETLVMHVLKADATLSGLYQTMLHEFLSREAGNYLYVNFEQDLGEAGLRKSKQSYHPLKMIQKYTLIPTLV
ncbi:MAG: DUF2156 domain-containing protein [Candidatus Omnitrophica bacterium]|nr:DUF2156 domain-containing protein [Candidatus Omnitrophota bacterium]